ncbi:AAA family ATPase [Clostridium sp. Marseille-P299]|uniref:AAA family ATPase n=1 Tax=Clostridium sp. Marseille-P299 TaxID=1805477 RepID=UPI00082E173D|nr:AAA family ATPase [Clostridium sp. Marseille-P299]
MNRSVVRIKSISITNFKNVTHGELSFENSRKPYKASIVGLYGQNGSGKTALIDAMQLLKLTLTGQPVPVQFADYINVDAEFATVRYEFKVEILQTIYEAIYEFSIKKELDMSTQNLVFQDSENSKYITTIFNEVLSCSYVAPEAKCRMSTLINTQTDEVFLPKTKYNIIIGNDKNTFTDLLVDKKMTAVTSRSFVFSKKLMMAMSQNDKNKDEDLLEFQRYKALLEALVRFGNYELFVINTTNSGLISMNALPISFKYQEKSIGAVGNFMLPLNEAATIPQEAFEVVQKVISNMNIVLEQLIPGLTISIRDLGTQVLENGKVGSRIQLMSLKNKKEIPLQYESEGIKKIVSILQLLIVVYNQPSITVAIDELDAGVFEYLLGEILRIISEKGKGQLIFTSHNLRPLETIDRGFIAFTTTNPLNRYIRMSKVKDNNNLRDFYYRDIVLGEQSEEVYDTTNNSEIALVFREAGELIGS